MDPLRMSVPCFIITLFTLVVRDVHVTVQDSVTIKQMKYLFSGRHFLNSLYLPFDCQLQRKRQFFLGLEETEGGDKHARMLHLFLLLSVDQLCNSCSLLFQFTSWVNEIIGQIDEFWKKFGFDSHCLDGSHLMFSLLYAKAPFAMTVCVFNPISSSINITNIDNTLQVYKVRFLVRPITVATSLHHCLALWNLSVGWFWCLDPSLYSWMVWVNCRLPNSSS